MNEAKDKVLALNVRLKSNDSSAHPRATNYTNVGVAQGIAYVDFGFIEPALLGAIAKTAKERPGGTQSYRRAARHAHCDGHRCAGSLPPAVTASLITCEMRDRRTEKSDEVVGWTILPYSPMNLCLHIHGAKKDNVATSHGRLFQCYSKVIQPLSKPVVIRLRFT